MPKSRAAEYQPPEPRLPIVGFVLLAEPLTNLAGLRAMLEGTLGLEVEAEEDSPNILQIFSEDGGAFLSVIDASLPGPEVGVAARRNYFWPDAADEVAAHTAHILITVIGPPGEQVTREKTLAKMQLFTNVAAATMGTDSAVGVYLPAQEVVHEAAPYRELALQARRDEVLPAPLIVHLMAAPQEGGGATGYTRGLQVFGHDDLQVLGSKHSPEEVYRLLANVALYVISADVTLRPEETLGYTEDMRLPITLADPAQYFEGRALQFDF